VDEHVIVLHDFIDARRSKPTQAFVVAEELIASGREWGPKSRDGFAEPL
jgi:hypothetical protein